MSFFSVSTPSTPTTAFSLRQIPTHPSFSSLTILVPNPSPNPRPSKFRVLQCRASKSQTRPVKKRQPSSSSNKKKKKGKNLSSDAEFVDDLWADDNSDGEPSGLSTANHPMPLPKPPAGFVVDDLGRVLMASNKRLVTIVDPLNNLPLECVIRRVFRSSKDEACMLLCPADMPVQILKSTNIEGWTALDDEEIEPMLPDVAYALAKIHMHLVQSGFCYTARGGFCYSEGDILDFCAAEGEDVDSLPTEGVEITCFHLDGSHYMIYTPSDPLLFVAVKDQNGQLRIADDDLLQDPAVISAIDEETEFNALVEEETALLESLIMGEG